jgi:hypothetical protein
MSIGNTSPASPNLGGVSAAGANTGGGRNGTISLDEFVGLWGYLNQWKGLFTRFDADNSGDIDRREFGIALGQFGYHLSDGFVGVLFTSYDKKGMQRLPVSLLLTTHCHDALGTSRICFANVREQGTGGWDLTCLSRVWSL